MIPPPRLSLAVLCLSLGAVTGALGDEPVARDHQVNAPVGLVIRSTPGTDGERLDTLEEGAQVTLAGKAVDGDKHKVMPVISKDAQDPDASWIQITNPKAGYVLYRVGGVSPYEYLVPCQAPVARLHQVNAPVGLIIRSKPGTDGKRLGSLEEGAKVTLAGKVADGDKTKVVPVVSKDAQDPDATWIKIAAPKAGYVLYRVGGAAPYEYLVPGTK